MIVFSSSILSLTLEHWCWILICPVDVLTPTSPSSQSLLFLMVAWMSSRLGLRSFTMPLRMDLEPLECITMASLLLVIVCTAEKDTRYEMNSVQLTLNMMILIQNIAYVDYNKLPYWPELFYWKFWQEDINSYAVCRMLKLLWSMVWTSKSWPRNHWRLLEQEESRSMWLDLLQSWRSWSQSWQKEEQFFGNLTVKHFLCDFLHRHWYKIPPMTITSIKYQSIW